MSRLELTNAGLENQLAWEVAGYELPEYNREEMIARTKAAPLWIHFGAGNIFRAFQANVVQDLLNEGVLDRGLIVAEGYTYDIITRMNHPHDDYHILVTLKSDGNVKKTVIGSVAESHILDSDEEDSFARLQEIFRSDSLQLASFTITEKGYSLTDAAGNYLPAVQRDFENGPSKPKSYLGKVAALLYARFCSARKPLAMVSMDNCSHNGDLLRKAMTEYAEHWAKQGHAEPDFINYLQNPNEVSFPWTMIDKITPRPAPSVEDILKIDNLVDASPIVTENGTHIAPFVNAEESEYLVIEDQFPNGRPLLEKGGIIFTDKETVEKVERMKVCTCLNPLHTALAVFGCLLGYDLISKELENETLRKLVERIAYQEGLPVVTDPIILNPKEFIDTVLNVRIPNPFMPDTPQRIATDTSQKLAVRFGETIKEYEKSDTLSTDSLVAIPLVFAGWLRYLMGIDDNGKPFALSPDPMLESLKPMLSEINLGFSGDVESTLRPILSNAQIFGVNLYEVSLAEKVCSCFSEMIACIGAVQRTLDKYIL